MINQMQLTPTQIEVLTLAADRPDGNIQPLPIRLPGGAKIKVLAGLLVRQLIAENNESHFLTDAGFRAVGKTPVIPTQTTQTRADSKQATIIAMLKQPEGVTIQQIMLVTGWQAHTVRGTLSGTIRKKLGLNLHSEKSTDADRVYRVT
jgi:hypothetical protein